MFVVCLTWAFYWLPGAWNFVIWHKKERKRKNSNKHGLSMLMFWASSCALFKLSFCMSWYLYNICYSIHETTLSQFCSNFLWPSFFSSQLFNTCSINTKYPIKLKSWEMHTKRQVKCMSLKYAKLVFHALINTSNIISSRHPYTWFPILAIARAILDHGDS